MILLKTHPTDLHVACQTDYKKDKEPSVVRFNNMLNHTSSSSPPAAATVQDASLSLEASADHILKPLFDRNEEVYAAWWKQELKDKNGENAKWYKGKIKSYRISDVNGSSPSPYGQTRLYHILYEDGDELVDLEDYWVCSKSDYELSIKFDKIGWKPIGVTEKYDPESTDEWARIVGWYVVNVNGISRSYAHLKEAMVAHDECVIREQGKHTKKSDLNFPELFFIDDSKKSNESKKSKKSRKRDAPKLDNSNRINTRSASTANNSVASQTGQSGTRGKK